MTDTRQKNKDWQLNVNPDEVAKKLLHCPNATDIPVLLRAIKKNTTERRR